MKCLVLIVVAPMLIVGCGAGQELEGPSILGITPELRNEMCRLIRTADPDADVELTVTEYMDRLRSIAKDAGIEPKENGDYLFPPELSDKLGSPTGAEIMNLAEEIGLDLPDWSLPLVLESESVRKMKKTRRELLQRIVFAQSLPVLLELDRQ